MGKLGGGAVAVALAMVGLCAIVAGVRGTYLTVLKAMIQP